MGWMTWVGIAAAPFTGGVSLALTAYDIQQGQQKKAQAAQEKAQGKVAALAKKQYELQAGDYAKQTAFEMKLNAAESQFQSLVDVIMNRQATPPNIMNLSAAESPNPLDRINKAIDDLLKGKW